jgi:hypothetical protein
MPNSLTRHSNTYQLVPEMNPDAATGTPSMTYTRNRVSESVNAGADIIRDALSLGDRDGALINLVVNAALTCLDEPDADFDDVVNANHAESPDQVRDWWDW